MSYTAKDALDSQEYEIMKAYEDRDLEALRKWAHILAGAGDEERGLKLLYDAQHMDDEDWAYDNKRDNEEELRREGI